MYDEIAALKSYLDKMDFKSMFKYLCGVNNYHVTPYKINDNFYYPNKEQFGLVKVLTFMEDVKVQELSKDEINLIKMLSRLEILEVKDEVVKNRGYQLISAKDMYLFIDGRINYKKMGTHQSYIGIDTYLMLYYIDTLRIKPNFKALDLCTGSGIGAIYMSRYCENVVATDIAELPLRLSNINILLNGKERRVRLKNEDFSETIKEGKGYDLITCNPPFVAFPEEINAPIFAKGYDEDGLGHFRLLFNKINDLLNEEGKAYFVSDFVGDEREPYFNCELRKYAEELSLDIKLFIDNKLDVKDQLAAYPYIVKEFNEQLSIEEIKLITEDFILNKLKAKYYYLSTLVITKSKENNKRGSFTCYNRYNSAVKKDIFSQIFNYI